MMSFATFGRRGRRGITTCMVTAVALTGTAASALAAGPPPATNPTIARANAIVSLDYRAFHGLPHNERPFDWSSDGCSLPVPVADNELFRQACDLHDFGYRNYGHGLALSPNEDTRNWIDDRFHDEMNRICDDTFSGFRNTSCRWDAEIYYGGVRNGGRGAFYNG